MKMPWSHLRALAPPRTAISAIDGGRGGGEHELTMYVENWLPCPADVTPYDTIVIAFAVTYTWAPAGNLCDETCTIPSSLPICGNNADPAIVAGWRAQGKRVYVSFGGAGMGAQRAAWQAAFVAELAYLQRLDHVQILLDLVKAFETIPHCKLIAAARAKGACRRHPATRPARGLRRGATL